MSGNGLMTYDDVKKLLGKGRSHLLLGNGFSIACDPIFKYESLYEIAKTKGLNPRAITIFEHIGSNNFERVLKLIEDMRWMVGVYHLATDEIRDQIGEDLENVKKTLIEALAETHPSHTGQLDDAHKEACADFLEPYHNIFTTNYDLLLYWVELYALQRLQGRDGFANDIDEPDAPYCVFSEHIGGNKGIFFIHGALHLYAIEGQVRKHTWSKSTVPLIQNMRNSLNEGQHPLFIAEGDGQKKLEQILDNGYLYYCLDKLARIESELVVFGLSFGHSESHIVDALARSKAPRIFVGLYGDPKNDHNKAIKRNVERIKMRRAQFQARKKRRDEEDLLTEFYDASTVSVWDELKR